MRQVTKQAVVVILGVMVVLLALGALPGLIKSGDPYYLTATPTTNATVAGPTLAAANGTITVDGTTYSAVDAATLDDARYPFTTAAVTAADPNASGRSEPYWRGPVGVKGAFTHSPFDERNALQRQYTNATTGDGVLYAHHDGTVYRLRIVQEGGQ